jgi:hypothetical protein
MKVINSPLRSKETTKAGPNSQERTSLTIRNSCGGRAETKQKVGNSKTRKAAQNRNMSYRYVYLTMTKTLPPSELSTEP